MIIFTLFAMLAQETGRTPEGIEQLRIRTAHTLDQGEVEIELVGSFLRFSDPDVDVFEGVLEVEYGITDDFMVEIEVTYLVLDPDLGRSHSGWGDAEIEAKHRLPWVVEGVSFALGAEVSIPTGDEAKGLGGGDPEFGLFGAASRRFGELALHFEGGGEVREESKPEYELNAAADWTPWGDPFSLLLAVNGEIESGDEVEWTLIPGFEIRFEGVEEGEGGEEEEWELQFGAGVPIGLSDDVADWGIIVDIELEF